MSRSRRLSPLGSGLVVVDKPSGPSSHDVVAKLRRSAGSRRVGHAGTLDPMASGVLLVGVERATKLLGHMALTDKSYAATIRLGESTTTDDAQGEPAGGADASGLSEGDVDGAVSALTGELQQVPSSVSAIKVDGKRAYALVRAGEQVELAARTVTVSRFEVVERRAEGAVLDLDVVVACTTGTYVRALARDLGDSLGVGGHLTALRRTRVGPFSVEESTPFADLLLLDDVDPVDGPLAEHMIALDALVERCYPRREIDAATVPLVRNGGRLPPTGTPGLVGVFGPDGNALALMQDGEFGAAVVVVLAPAGLG